MRSKDAITPYSYLETDQSQTFILDSYQTLPDLATFLKLDLDVSKLRRFYRLSLHHSTSHSPCIPIMDQDADFSSLCVMGLHWETWEDQDVNEHLNE